MAQDSQHVRKSINFKPQADATGIEAGDLGVDGSDADRLVYNAGSGAERVLLQQDADSAAFTDAANVDFDNTASGLTADNVQDAVDEVEGRLDTVETDVAGKADQNLGNLDSPTAINQDLLPDSTDIRDLGSSSNSFRDLHLTGNVNLLNTSSYARVMTDDTQGIQIDTQAETAGVFLNEDGAQLFGANSDSIGIDNTAGANGTIKIQTPTGAVEVESGTGNIDVKATNVAGSVRINYPGSNAAGATVIGGASITAKANVDLDTNDVTNVDQLSGRRASLAAVNTTEVNLTLKKVGSQSVNLLEFKNESDAVIGYVNQNATLQVPVVYALNTQGTSTLGSDGSPVTVNSSDVSNQFVVYSGATNRRIVNISSRTSQTANILEVNSLPSSYGGDIAVITAAGDVGVGESSPGSKLTVNGRIESKTGGVRLKQGGSNYIDVKADASLATDYTITLPAAAPASGTALVYNGSAYEWGTVSGSGAVNFIGNSNAESSTSGWATYADAAASSPVDGTGGSPNVTWTRSTSSPLIGTANFLLTKDAANRQGQGASYAFSIDSAYQAKVLQIQFEYAVGSGTFAAGSSSADSDITVWIYDVTNGVLIQPSTYKLFASNSLSTTFVSNFQTASNSTSYRLIFHCASTSASAYTLKVDDVRVSPSNYAYGTPITDWTSYTPTGTWVTNTTYTGRWRRVGDTAEYDVLVSLTGAPTNTALSVTIPSGQIIDTSKLANSDTGVVYGMGQAVNGGTGYEFAVLHDTTTQIRVLYKNASLTPLAYSALNATTPVTWANGNIIHVTFRAPISGWSSSVQTSDQADSRIVAARYTATSSAAVPNSATVFDFSTKDIDTHSAVTTGASWKFTAPVAGIYRVNASLNIDWAASASRCDTALRKNGVAFHTQYVTSSGTQVQTSTLNTLINLNAGDYIDITHYETVNGGVYSGSGQQISIERLSQASLISATETVAATYTTLSSTTVTATTALRLTTAKYDTHSAYNTSNGRFTAPVAGVYRVSYAGLYTTSSVCELNVYVNGSLYTGPHVTATTTARAGFSATVRVNAGDYITVVPGQSVTAGDTSNSMSIERIGL